MRKYAYAWSVLLDLYCYLNGIRFTFLKMFFTFWKQISIEHHKPVYCVITTMDIHKEIYNGPINW